MTNPSMILSALKERLENIRNEDNEPLLKRQGADATRKCRGTL